MPYRHQVRHWLKQHRWPLLFFIGWAIYFTRFWSGLFFFDTAGNLQTTHINIWGDWAAHFTMGSSFAYHNLIPVESPFLAGATFSYPFAVNWVSGVLVRLGVPFLTAFVVPSWLLSIFVVISIYIWYKTWLGSQKRALTASLLMLCTGGMGFIFLGQKIFSSADPWHALLNLPGMATNNADVGIRWLSMVDSMIIPQRAFALGFPWALLSLAFIYRWLIASKTPPPTRYLILVGIALGLLPLIHMHSFLAVGVVIFCWMLTTLHAKRGTIRWQQLLAPWLWIGISTLAVSIPLYVYFFANQVGGFIRWTPGWLAPEFHLNWLDFWARNWGPTLLLSIVGVFVSWRSRRARTGYPFLIWFILPNLILFQPWNWDNTKLLIWSAVGICGFATMALAWLWQKKSWLSRSIVVSIFFITIFAGAIDLYWIQRRDLHTYQMYTAEEWLLAEWVRANTSTTGRWLTANQHNHWLFNLTGRQTLLAYPGWLWTQGYDYRATEEMVRSLWQNPTPTKLEAGTIKYVVIGPEERQKWGGNDSIFTNLGNKIKQTENYSVYQVRY